jgi:lipopolysaccharide/colanic/teichoic acid biosynthesis glycosyltransferase
VLFRQQRVGEGGRLFEIFKFRTMVRDAEEPGRPVWAANGDARVTPVGRILRRSRIDELPQLWNVLRGEMSFVGPRPERPEFLTLLEETVPNWSRRHLVKPGITGWAQVRLGYTADAVTAADKLSYDFYYLKHQGLLLDLAIAAKTVGTIFSGAGAH